MLTNIFCRQGSRLDPLPSPSSHGVAESCPLLPCWQERAAILLCVLHPPGRSIDGIFPGGSSYQSFSCASCHLKVSADSNVELSMSWICRRTWGLLQFSSKQQVLLVSVPMVLQKLVSLQSGCAQSASHVRTLASQLIWPDRPEKAVWQNNKSSLEGRGRWEEAATVTSTLL